MLPDPARDLLSLYAVYLIAVASPGPSTMAIMGVAMRQGRASAVLLALGVVAGSMVWAALAAAGLSAVLAAYAEIVFAIKIAGGLYLLYLAWNAARSALAADALASDPLASDALAGTSDEIARSPAPFRRGLLLHLTNPKAILGWIAIMSLASRPDAQPYLLHLIVGGCAVLGLAVNVGYALVFSTSHMGRAYRRCRRGIEAALAAIFGCAGLRLVLSRP